MKVFLYIRDDKIGEVDLKIIDQGMGVIGGKLTIYSSYEKYRKEIQLLYETKGTANSDDFRFTAILEDNTALHPAGGIAVTDSVEFNERLVEICGVDSDIAVRVGVEK